MSSIDLRLRLKSDSSGPSTFNYKNTISQLLAKSNINVFDELINEIEAYFHRQVTSIAEMKARDSKKAKGDVWELLCRDWLIASQKYINVWLWKDYCAQFNAGGPKQDNGIDIVAQTATGWVAIQCKYRSKDKKVEWKGLSTFIGLCERMKCFEKYVVITNCHSITRKLPPSAKDQSICVGTFRSTTREHWLRMIGQFQEHRLTDSSTTSQPGLPTGLSLKIIDQTTNPIIKSTNPKTLDELRAARLAKFETAKQ